MTLNKNHNIRYKVLVQNLIEIYKVRDAFCLLIYNN